MLQEKLRVLAKANVYLEDVNRGLNRWKEELKECPTYQLLSEAEAEAKKTKDEMSALRDEIKELILIAYAETGKKTPAPCAGIRASMKPVYTDQDAVDFCLEHLHAGLKLDKRLFEKHAKAVAETQPLDFVTFEESLTATIASDLSEYLESED